MAGAGYYFYCAGYIGFNRVIWQKKGYLTFYGRCKKPSVFKDQ